MAKKKKKTARKSPASTSRSRARKRGATALKKTGKTGTRAKTAKVGKAARTKTRTAGTSSKSGTPARPARRSGGKGTAPAEIGRDLVTLVNLGKSDEAISKWYHAQIESVEGDGQSWKGMKALRAKNAWWYSTNELHSCQAEGPYTGATGFAVRYTMAFTPKDGHRTEMSEVGVYTVRNGKIVREEYMYAG